MGIYGKGRPSKYNPTTRTGSKPPSAPEEYRIRDEQGKIVYVGETNNLNRRMNEHRRNRKIKQYFQEVY